MKIRKYKEIRKLSFSKQHLHSWVLEVEFVLFELFIDKWLNKEANKGLNT